jgi:hypothetical protein
MARPFRLSPEQIEYVRKNHTPIEGIPRQKADPTKLSTKELAVKFGVVWRTIKRALRHGKYYTATQHSARLRQSQSEVLKQKCIDYKGGSCVKCGYNTCTRALDFHHLDSNSKAFTIGNHIVSAPPSSFLDENKEALLSDALIQELDKCILICSNCHRELHYKGSHPKNSS